MLSLTFLFLFSFALALASRTEGAVELADTYIVKFKDGITDEVRSSHTAWIKSLERFNEDGTVAAGLRHEFSLAFQGYSAVLDNSVLERVRNSPEVSEVKNVGTSIPQPLYLTQEPATPQTDIATTQRAVSGNGGLADIFTENNKGWNANRISHRNYASKGYNNGPWLHDGYLGQGVDVFILDTGVNLAQPGFAGSAVVHDKNFVRGTNASDVNGHGTMCAGVIAGRYAGLSPKAKLRNVKIANDLDRAACDDTVAGIEYVANSPGNNNMKVISLSQTGFTGKPDVATAAAAAVRKGVHVVVCAGNFDVDACGVQPGNAPGVISVGSIDPYNKFPTQKDSPEGTNVGRCVTLFAPGSRVPTLSTKNLSPDYHYFAWGTSIAAPQVAALIANRLSQVGPVTPDEMKKWLVATATKDQIVGNLRGSPNLIAFSGVDQGKGNGGAGKAANEIDEEEAAI